MFHVGQKVVCLTDDWFRVRGVTYPVRNSVYTIRGMFSSGDETGLLLGEIVTPAKQWCDGYREPVFCVDFFRPVKTTNIDVFTAMLAPQSKEPANA